jgi:hypothetical protein
MPEGSLKAKRIYVEGGTCRKWGMTLPKFRETLTRMPISLRSKGNTLIKEVIPLRDPGTLIDEEP